MFSIISQNATLILSALSTLMIPLLAWTIFTEVRLRRFMRGKSGESLENTIAEILKQNNNMHAFEKEVRKALEDVRDRLGNAARGIATMRFNAFDGRGESGSQSFATAIVSERGDGVVISSMHTREQTRVFAKALKQFASEHELTDEEQEAIREARGRL